MGQPLSADYEIMLSCAERIDAMAAELEAKTAPMLAALTDGAVMSSMSQGLGPIGAPFTASFMTAATNQCMNSMEIAAGMHAHAEAIRESAAQYEGSDELHAASLAAEQTMNDDLAQAKEAIGETQAALPVNLKDQLDPLDPGQTQFIGDIASTRDPAGHAGIKGADLGIPAKLADGTPIMLFGDSNKPGDPNKEGYYGGIVAAKVENTPDGVRVTGIAGWGPGALLKDQPPAGQVSYPSGVIRLDDGRQLLTIADVKVEQNADGTPSFGPQASHLVQIGGAQGGWETVGKNMDIGSHLSYATGEQVGDRVWVAGTENDNGAVHLFDIPVGHITDQASWGQYMVKDDSGIPVTISSDSGQTPHMTRVGDQYVLSYMDDNGVNVRIADTPGGFAAAQAQTLELEHHAYPNPPGFGAAYGGYILPDSQPEDLRFAVSYFDTSEEDNFEPYGVGEWRYRPTQ